MKVFVLLSILSGCLGGTPLAAQAQPACSLFDATPKRDPTQKQIADAVLLDAYNAQVHRIRSLYAAALVSGETRKELAAGKHAEKLPGIIDMVKPDLVRIRGVLRLNSSRGFEMTSDGHEFSLLVPEDNKKVFLVGPSDAPARSKIPRENLRPQPFLDALRWQEGKLRATSGAAGGYTGPETRTLEIELPPARNGVRTAKVEFDLRGGVVNSLAAYGDAGQLIYEAKYRDWKEMKPPSEKGPAGCFPRDIHLARPEDDYELNLRITQIDLNPDIPMSTFRPSPPRGVPVVRLDGMGNPIQR